MQIIIKRRSFFEARQGTYREALLLRQYSIISINSICLPEEAPFSRCHMQSSNLLILHFDDVEEGMQNAMTDDDAAKIQDFISRRSKNPIIIHCTAGISRSGAVGEVLNYYFNRYLEHNEQSFKQFYRDNPDIDPNPYIRHKLWGKLMQKEG